MDSKTLALIRRLAALEFKPFTQTDWDCWSGCESDEPLIAYEDGKIVIIDGEVITIYHASMENDQHEIFQLLRHRQQRK